MRLAAGLALVLALAGCTLGGPAAPPPAPPATGPVEVTAPPLARGDARRCAALVAALPATLGPGLDRRPVPGAAEQAAAWGDPAITLVCGAEPAGAPGVDGEPFDVGPPGGGIVRFLVDDVGAANVFTTRDREVPVAVTVPDASDAQSLVPLLPAVQAALPAVEPDDSPRGR